MNSAFLIKKVFPSVLLLCLTFGLFVNVVHAQDPNFGWSVDEFVVELNVLSPVEGDYYYGWIVEDYDPSCESNCYDLYGQNTSETIDMMNFEGTSNLSPEVYLEVADSNGDIIASTSRTVSVGNGVEYTDSDGDGEPDSGDDCPDDPDNECESGGNDDDDDDGGGDGGDGGTEGLVNCGNPGADGELQESEMCDYEALMSLIQDVINWLIGILTVAATLLFVYAGILYLTAAGNDSQVDTAKEIFRNVAGGFVIVLLAFTIIATLVNLLTSEDWQDTWDGAIPIQLSQEADTPNELS